MPHAVSPSQKNGVPSALTKYRPYSETLIAGNGPAANVPLLTSSAITAICHDFMGNFI
jgi:hypothetical protein